MKRFKAVYLVLAGLLVSGAMSVALASDNFGELNVKAGLNLSTKFKSELELTNRELLFANLKPGVSFAGEYLILAEHLVSSLDFLKFGVGLKYLLPTKLKDNDLTLAVKLAKFSYLPIYFTLQINPFVKSNEEYLKGLFVKGDIGYSAYSSSNFKELLNNSPISTNIKDKGGLYYAFGAGYEFPCGLVFDITYGIYKSSVEVSENMENMEKRDKINFTYSCVGLNVGYKFKI
ncbi:MAG: outer membrane beta-barrel protein [Endomicrobium sp.]|jgi:hypothetical protein|nr:outer membrane beta-barrel protein [Endomicrobium sp.]